MPVMLVTGCSAAAKGCMAAWLLCTVPGAAWSMPLLVPCCTGASRHQPCSCCCECLLLLLPLLLPLLLLLC
jgi:hypothetical protein